MNHERNQAVDSSTVAIIGGGFSGSMLAVELLHRAAGNISVVLIERKPDHLSFVDGAVGSLRLL